jgi:two-component system, NarL family, nitrate/nitrite response regulator NarL
MPDRVTLFDITWDAPPAGMTGAPDIGIVTENVIMSDGIRAWLSQAGGGRLVTAAATVEGFLLVKAARPQVVLLDLCRRGEADPAPDVRRLIARRHRVLALGTIHDPHATATAYAAGAHGYISREQSLADLAVVIRVVAAGRLLSQPGTSLIVGDRPFSTRPVLSKRERAVLVAYISGMTLEAAARHVGVRPDTAKTYLRRVKAKYHAAGRPAYTKVELARRVWEENGGSHAPP